MKTKLNPLTKKRWVNALRSGKYNQTTHKLKYTKLNENMEWETKYCCLGVACAIKIAAPHVDEDICKATFLDMEIQRKLAKFNDSGKWSFKRIAAYIERYL